MLSPANVRHPLRWVVHAQRYAARATACPCGCAQFHPGLSTRRPLATSAAPVAPRLPRVPRGFRRYATEAKGEWATETEQEQAKMVEAAKVKVDLYKKTMEEEANAMEIDIKAQIERARIQKELAPLSEVWDKYLELRKASAWPSLLQSLTINSPS
ncbi:hypothetical protein C369_07388 [Cryptococcus neoformans A5-35-17]|nr:hypothetical protein C369_07388 [Cryptococcus neoformans var. grubii A5-35-17]